MTVDDSYVIVVAYLCNFNVGDRLAVDEVINVEDVVDGAVSERFHGALLEVLDHAVRRRVKVNIQAIEIWN